MTKQSYIAECLADSRLLQAHRAYVLEQLDTIPASLQKLETDWAAALLGIKTPFHSGDFVDAKAARDFYSSVSGREVLEARLAKMRVEIVRNKYL